MEMKKKTVEIVPGVYIIGGPGVSSGDDCCVYLIESKDELCIIDTGAGKSAGMILEQVKKAGFDLEQVRFIVITHGHIDHIGGLKKFKETLNAQIIAHELDLPAIEEARPELTAQAWYGVKYEGVKVDRVLAGDESFSLGDIEIYCLHTPGHTPGSISVFVEIGEKKVLFAQDVHGPFFKEWGSDKKQWRESMQLLLDLNADILCEGHYGIYQPADKVKSYIQGYLQRF
jgi:glyoxylase-like metal-dependent hydrolase (beta-lactamase superfamily II)